MVRAFAEYTKVQSVEFGKNLLFSDQSKHLILVTFH